MTITVIGSTGTIGTELVRLFSVAGGPTARVSESVEQIFGRAPRSIRDITGDSRQHFTQQAHTERP
jgi:hypothetical protein